MSEQKFALHALLNLTKLSKEEISGLSLTDLHLSGANPHLEVGAKKGEVRSVKLDETTKNALVLWLVARPDQPSPVLFPDEAGIALTAAKIDALMKGYDAPSLPDTGKKPLGEDILTAEKLPLIPTKKKAPAPPPFSAVRPATSPERIAVSPPESHMGDLPTVQGSQSVTLRPKWGGILIGGLALIACIGLVFIGSMLIKGRNTADEQAAIMGDAPTFAAAEVTPPVENTIEATAALEATNTPTPMPTNTPLPTATATDTPPSTKTDTPTAIPSPTDTVAPSTATPAPTDSPTPVPAVVPRPTATPTSGFKYPAPVLLSPEKGAYFIVGNLIDLKWESVGELAGNEQYAVRLVYSHNAELVYRGDSLKEMVWRVPTGLYRDADGPAFDYEWYVYVEEIQPDGTGIPVSPESEHWHFKWE